MEYIIGVIFIALVTFFFLNRKKIEVIEEVKAVEKTVVEEVKAVEAVVEEVVKKVRKPRATPATSAAKKPAAKKAVVKKPTTLKKA